MGVGLRYGGRGAMRLVRAGARPPPASTYAGAQLLHAAVQAMSAPESNEKKSKNSYTLPHTHALTSRRKGLARGPHRRLSIPIPLSHITSRGSGLPASRSRSPPSALMRLYSQSTSRGLSSCKQRCATSGVSAWRGGLHARGGEKWHALTPQPIWGVLLHPARKSHPAPRQSHQQPNPLSQAWQLA